MTTVGVLGAMAAIGHVLYPALLLLAGRRRPERLAPAGPGAGGQWPSMTVVVPAYREAGVIGAKVADVLANGYPGRLSVVVVAEGDDKTADAARASGAVVLTSKDRLGKAQALNVGVAAAEGDLVVVSDANNRLRPGSLQALARWFADPDVAAVAGSKVEEGGGESLYWQFESWLKRREWRLGTTIGLVGELAAIRRSAWRAIPRDIGTDDLWIALDLCGRGHRIAYEPEAVAIEAAVGSTRSQWERRTRSVAGALHVFRRRRWQLGPAGGLVAVEIWGHRLGRYVVSPAGHLGLLGLALARSRRSWIARAFVGLHLAVGVLEVRAGSNPDGDRGRISWAVHQAAFLQAVAIGGVWRHLRGDHGLIWPHEDR